MDKTEFARRLKEVQFVKHVSVDGARGYSVTFTRSNGRPFTLTAFGAPDQKGKTALQKAREMLLRDLAREWGYTGELASFR